MDAKVLYETERLSELQSLHILDSLPEKEYDGIVEIAAGICNMPVATISLIDENRQWFKSCLGLELKETDRNISFCTHAIREPDEPLIIPDATLDDRFKNNPLVVGSPNIRFYAGFPILYNGYAIGTLCVIDMKPNNLDSFQVNSLSTLAKNIGHLLKLRNDQTLVEREKNVFIKALNLNSKFFLILESGTKIKEIGENFIKAIPEIKIGEIFSDYFQWYSRFSIEAFLLSNREDHKGMVLLDSKNHKQRYKCSVSKLKDQIIISASPVINFEFPIENYHLKTKDFAHHDSILEFLFLQETTSRNIAEARQINEKITKKSLELENAYNSLKQKEEELTNFNLRIQEQKNFYENILNNFPTDIAVFSNNHSYIYLNAIAIKDEKIRSFLIGKTDYDYADLKGLDYKVADLRRKEFLEVIHSKTYREWEDSYANTNEEKRVLLRRFSPVLNEKGEVTNVIGYGADITKLKEYQYKIEAQNREILNINQNLEKIVEEKTLKNNELTQMMANQDKLAMIGEVTAGITHDLNTPLSSILLGSENLLGTFEEMLSKTMQACSASQLNYAIERSANNDVAIFTSGLQASKNIASIENFILNLNTEIPAGKAKELAKALNKAKIKPEETDAIEFILKQPNNQDFINLIYEVNNIRFFLNTIHQAAERSSGVIKNLRYYLKEGSSVEKTQVHLRNSFETVLSIFNHEIQKGIEVHMKIPDSIIVEAYESKIYQLWSNIIKNAIDAMSQKGNLYIEAREEKKLIHIKIANDGQMIPEEIREKIFDKFFTTKDEVRGTGLGLNIVKQVIDEHRGKISVSSDEELTSFHLVLPKN